MQIRLHKLDWSVIFLCTAIVLVSSILLYREHTGSAIEEGSPIGTIVYRNRVAQKRDSRTVLWQDVDQLDPVYDQDSVRTDELAEAVVILEDQSTVELDSNSMVVIDFSQEQTRLDFQEGGLKVEKGRKPLEIKTKEGSFQNIEKEARFFQNKEGGLDVISKQGKILWNWEGKTKEILPGQIATIRNGSKSVRDIGVELTLPEDNERFFTQSKSESVHFEWNSEVGCLWILSQDYAQKSSLLSERVSGRVLERKLTEGVYFWSVQCGQNRSETRRFRVQSNPPIEINSPADKSNVILKNAKERTFLSWMDIESAAEYHVIVARDEGLKTKVWESDVRRTSVSVPLPEGNYFWTVSSRELLKNSSTSSKISSFHIRVVAPSEDISQIQESASVIESEKDSEVSEQEMVQEPAERVKANRKRTQTESKTRKEKPQVKQSLKILSPATGSVVDMSAMDTLPLSWKAQGIESFQIRLFKGGPKGKKVFETETSAQSFSVKDLSVLDVGTFYFEVEGVSLSGKSSGIKVGSSFNIKLRDSLQKPELKMGN